MPLHLIQFASALVVMLGVAVLLRRRLGQRARQDGLLFAMSVLSAGFLIGGIVGILLSEKGATATLGFGVLGALAAGYRWRASDAAEPPARGA